MAVLGAIVAVAAPALLAVWAAASLARVASRIARRRRLPPTRHARHIQLDLWG
jgi:hypothetical protein